MCVCAELAGSSQSCQTRRSGRIVHELLILDGMSRLQNNTSIIRRNAMANVSHCPRSNSYRFVAMVSRRFIVARYVYIHLLKQRCNQSLMASDCVVLASSFWCRSTQIDLSSAGLLLRTRARPCQDVIARNGTNRKGSLAYLPGPSTMLGPVWNRYSTSSSDGLLVE